MLTYLIGGLFLLAVVIPPPLDSQEITIGYLIQEFEAPFRAAAINLAIEDAQADGLVPGMNFRYMRSERH